MYVIGRKENGKTHLFKTMILNAGSVSTANIEEATQFADKKAAGGVLEVLQWWDSKKGTRIWYSAECIPLCDNCGEALGSILLEPVFEVNGLKFEGLIAPAHSCPFCEETLKEQVGEYVEENKAELLERAMGKMHEENQSLRRKLDAQEGLKTIGGIMQNMSRGTWNL